LKPESVFKLNQNRCSDWTRMSVQVEPEYALVWKEHETNKI
jgi:hypothetical protein